MNVITPANVRSIGGLKSSNRTAPKSMYLSVYGAGGSGKTTLCSKVVEAEDEGPAALFDVDKSSASVVHLQQYGLDIYDINTWNEIKKIRDNIVKDGGEFKSYIFDNLSEILALCVKHYAPRGMPEGSDALKTWGMITADMMEFVRDVRNACVHYEKNLFMSLWEETEKDTLTGITRIKSLLTPKFGAAFPGMTTLMARLSVVGTEKTNYIRLVDFAPNEKLDTKFRIAPTDEAANIPMQLYVGKDANLVVDMIATIKHGKKFPVDKYKKPKAE